MMSMIQRIRFALPVCLLTLCAVGAAAKPADLVDVKVFPADINLATKQDRQSIVVQATYSDGVTRDVTTQASFSLGNKSLVRLAGSTLHPLADGSTELKVKFSGRTVAVPVKVEKSSVERPISFTLDVVPALTKAGCNTGSCHGASRGKDGFRLSLFGYDVDSDYHRITREMIGRRVNTALPDESLILEKGAGRVPHTGGERFKPGDELYSMVQSWVKDGAPKDKGTLPGVVKIEIYPRQAVLEGEGSTQRMTVRALYSDGTDRDVTSLAVFMSNNDVSAKVTPQGTVTAAARGESFVMARFEAHTVGAQFLVIPKNLKFNFPQTPENNYVDTLVNEKLKKLRIAPSELCDDATFIRRVQIDLVGKLPTTEEVRKFTADTDPKKREVMIDQLIQRPEFSDIWVMKWAELLQVRTDNQVLRFSPKSVFQYYNWLEKQVSGNVPVNEVVQQLVNATGGSFENPAANFYKVENDTLKLAENAAQVFMGMRIQCAQCHNHPFDRWTMNDYYGFASFFAQVGRKNGEDPRETVVFNRATGGVRHPVGNRDVAPKFLGGAVPEIKDQDRRAVLAKWLASPDNAFFGRNFANIVWAHFMGKGIIDPVDDVRISNPASNPELLDALAKKFTEHKYDLRKLVKDVCNSRTYQLSVQSNDSNAGDTMNFAKGNIRRIRAEVLLDAINQVTDTTEKFNGLPRGSRAVEIADGRTTSFFLTTFGRATRETVCSCEVKMEPNLSQALHLLNGDTVNQKVQNGGVVRKLLKDGKTPAQIIDDMYLRCLGRSPTAAEKTKLEGFLGEPKKHEETLNDLFWSLLNSKEFIFNH
jgi:hypothetical protein